MTVSGGNISAQDISDEFSQTLAELSGKVTYQKLAKAWFVVSWEDPSVGQIGYQKTFVGSAEHNTFLFVYPTDQRTRYDKVLTKISKSFRPGPLSR